MLRARVSPCQRRREDTIALMQKLQVLGDDASAPQTVYAVLTSTRRPVVRGPPAPACYVNAVPRLRHLTDTGRGPVTTE